jgi:hypothetical protein
MFAPFGVEFYSPISNYSVIHDSGDGAYIIEPPTPHPMFAVYAARATPALGVVWVKGITTEIENDAFGVSTRAIVDRILGQLAPKYGVADKLDELMPGSIWDEPRDWLSGLNNNERLYHYTWEKSISTRLPEELESIFLAATGGGGNSALVVLEYASSRLLLADAEIDRGMADVL